MTTYTAADLTLTIHPDHDPMPPSDWCDDPEADEPEALAMYQDGDVWGFVIEDSNGNHLDSCWSMYGYDYCREAGRDALFDILDQQNAGGTYAI